MNIKEFYDKFRIELGEQVLKKHVIYLDIKFWIHMRDASLGTTSNKVHTEIYDRLKLLSQNNLIICPLSESLFQELINIGDENKRLQTAAIMDELSQQISFISPLEIAGQELICFMRNCKNKAQGKTSFNPAKYVWTKIALVDHTPKYDENFSVADNEHIQVEFLKFLSKHTLVEILGRIKTPSLYDKTSMVKKLNIEKDQNLDFKTFQEVFMDEIEGMLYVIQNDITEVMKFLYFQETGKKPTASEIEKFNSDKNIQKIIYTHFKLGKGGTKFPYTHIQAAIYAFIRWNKSQRFKENDLADISHATWGLSYCNAFFTERKLASWISNPPLSLQEIYSTVVLYKEEDIINYLKNI